MFGDQERAESRDRGQRGLDKVIVRGPGDRDRRRADKKPDREPAPRYDQKGLRCGECRYAGRVVRRPDEDQREKDRGGAVVDQAFGFDEEPQSAGHAVIPAIAR